METTNYGHLSRQLKDVFDRSVARDAAAGGYDFGVKSDLSTIGFLIGEFSRLERIVSALESIGVSLDESDIEALEGIARALAGSASDMRTSIREALNQATNEWMEESREAEQESAVAALTNAGFVLDDEDGETWTKEGVTVKIECVHPAESRYKWEYEMRDSRPGKLTVMDFGVSGEFHRLLALISGEVKS